MDNEPEAMCCCFCKLVVRFLLQDWMDVEAARSVQKDIFARRGEKGAGGASGGGQQQQQQQAGCCRVIQLPDCGHQLYIENPTDFSKAVLDSLSFSRN